MRKMQLLAVCVASLVLSAVGGQLHVMWGAEGVDDARTTAELRVHRMQYDRDILRFDAPWEGDGCGGQSFIVDQDDKGTLYRLYYICWSVTDYCAGKPGAKIYNAYMESRDGVNWIRPELGQVEFRGSKKNNLLSLSEYGYFFKDTNPNCPPEERYKATVQREGKTADGKKTYYLGVCVSADGINFKPGGNIIAGNDPYMKFDTSNVIFYDHQKGVYKAYVRGVHDQTEKSLFSLYYKYIRTNFVCESKDFKTWTKPVPLRYQADAEDVNLYTPATLPCHVFVTLRGSDGAQLKSCELFGDRVDRKVRLGGGDIAAMRGKKVTLEFALLDADLYSYHFADR